MAFPGKVFLPFRLKLLLVMLTAAGAGIYLSYSGFRNALRPFSEGEAGNRLFSSIELAGAVIDEDVRAALERARLTAARTGLGELLARYNLKTPLPSDPADLARRLAGAAAGSDNLTGLDLAGINGKIAASLEKGRVGLDLSSRADFRLGLKSPYISAPRSENGTISYEITVPVPAPPGAGPRPLGALRCRFKIPPVRQAAAQTLREKGFIVALAKKSGQHLVLDEGKGPAREVSLKALEGAPFLPALSGKEGVSSMDEGKAGRMLYGWRTIPAPDWIIAAKVPFETNSAGSAMLLERARLNSLLAFVFLAAAAFFAVNLLAAPLCEAGRQAAALLEQCGKPAGDRKDLCEPAILARAIEEAAGTIKGQASHDMELETETEKLREEEADLKSQNDELEKLNKYLMEREIKISELKKEIDDLREKVAGGAQD
ncbi:MAG: hypothetical protein A2X35_05930 [Elusimicrobia bacterium GWA2_61_42]|nr:MAG: hypothetical protein A2X35_05930 [Elusimicrobia bacterium GWA2_61_42]OGR80304.1 MAG: hypothetical protein A2X38_00955 [Elusimicrobia bacterium GWC2_61_25]